MLIKNALGTKCSLARDASTRSFPQFLGDPFGKEPAGKTGIYS